MAETWGLAFCVAAVVALGAGALLRRAARRRDTIIDFRRVGGVALLAVLVGWAFAPHLSDQLLALGAATLLMAVIGILADAGILRRRLLLAAIVATAVVPVLAGVRFDLLGVPGPDAVVTVLWIGCVAAAIAGLGNTEGLLGGVVATAAAGAFGLAAFAAQDSLATVMIALAGAVLGFLAYNLRPASLFVGQAGGLVAGVVLAVGSIEIRPSIGAPDGHLVPLILLALPITDAIVVTLGRLNHRRQLTARRPDHLAHRLRAMGWSSGRVAAVLTFVQLVLSALALFVGRGVLAPVIAAGATALVMIAVLFVALHGRVYEEPRRGPSAVATLLLGALVLLAVAAAVPAMLAGLEARDSLERARTLAERAISAAREGDSEGAAARFREAARLFADAQEPLESPLVSAALAVPVLGSNVHAVRTLTDAGLELARAGVRLTAPVDPEKLRFREGTIDLAEVARITPSLDQAAKQLTRTNARVNDLDRGLLIGPVKEALGQVTRELSRAERDAVRGAAAARIAPAVLGGDGPRRYFLAVQNPAELRGSGGFIGNWGIITAENGKLRLEFIERVRVLNEGGDPAARTISGPAEYLRRYGVFEPARAWQNVNMSPDFAVVGKVISELYPQSGGEPVDGVIGVDPKGLQALLKLTGPVRVPDWPDPISESNVVDVTLRDAYAVFARTPDRADFLGDVARRAVDVATSGDLGRPGKIADALGPAARAGHISLYFTRPEEESIAGTLNANGAVPRSEGDSLMVVTQNAGANKIDYYLRRQVRYALQVEPGASGEPAHVRGTIEVRLVNTAPDAGLPQSVIGPSEGLEDRFVAGENVSYVSVYTPLGVTAVRVDDEPSEVEVAKELGRNVFSAWLHVNARSQKTLVLEVDGDVPLRNGWYDLDLVRQPFLAADDVRVEVSVPDGWEITEAERLVRTGERTAEAGIPLRETTPVRVRVAPSSGLGFWDRLRQGA